MPKMKTHSGAKKRFRTTGSGKVTHRKAGKTHLNEHKPSKRLRRVDAFEQGYRLACQLWLTHDLELSQDGIDPVLQERAQAQTK